jgi:hypothetical protein
MLKLVISKIKREIFGERAKGESIYTHSILKSNKQPDRPLSTIEDIEAYNNWCKFVNFSGMYVKDHRLN